MASLHRVRNVFSDVADAIRAKRGINGLLHPYDFADQIALIDSPTPNVYCSVSSAPSDTTSLWVITDTDIAFINCVDTPSQVLNSGILEIVGGGSKSFSFLAGGVYSIHFNPSAVRVGSADGTPIEVTAALYDDDGQQWKTLSGDNYAIVPNNNGDTVLIVGNYTITDNGSGNTITVL